MKSSPDDNRAPYQRVDNIDEILAAMRQGVREALLLHRRLGYPIVVWRNNRVEWIQLEDIPEEWTALPAAQTGG